MRVGIFGDSFAVSKSPQGWSNQLSNRFGWDIKNFAHGGSSLFWAYQQLLTEIDNVDQVIFVIARAGRLHTDNPRHFNISSFVSVTEHLKNNRTLPAEDLSVFRAAEQYYIFLNNKKFNAFVHQKIIESVQSLCKEKNKKLLMIPTHLDQTELSGPFNIGLVDILNQELMINFGNKVYKQEKLTRSNHMSKENNEILSMLVNQLLREEQVTVSLENFVFKEFDDKSVYWYV